jgi:hypothetical protein
MLIECDPGTFWIGTQCQIMMTGGTPGDSYDVTITESTSQQQSDSRRAALDPPFYQVDVFEPDCQFVLTSFGVGAAGNPPPGLALHHTKFSVVAGTATYGGVAITPTRWLPLNASITIGANTIYQTAGGV